ncbi:MAG: S-methyl-5'-thioinosine phosphorylase [Actinomycetota bacterium]|nr:S-methyl-5'-thioinosine phosphorylase [Actinomycetota bacterium]MDG2121086.1 S-methyl-5'-thioinosine phosphorylase [Actinomycetota bacterium]
MIGIIAGTGFYALPDLMNRSDQKVKTLYGEAAVSVGLWNGQQIAFVARHGGDHSIPPSSINYRANVKALEQLGVEAIFAVNVVASLLPDEGPGSLFLVSDFLEFTQGRLSTFFDKPGEVRHTDMTTAYDQSLRSLLSKAADLEAINVRNGATYVCTNGPRFETPAEIRMFSNMGAELVGMTGYPEVALARELNIPYSSLAVVSNSAAGHGEGEISLEEIWEVLDSCKDKIFRLLSRAVQLWSTGEC